jgi:hypothetical protein
MKRKQQLAAIQQGQRARACFEKNGITSTCETCTCYDGICETLQTMKRDAGVP